MDNFNNDNLSGSENLDNPTPPDDSSQMKVSHSPLNLGGGSPAEVTKPPVQKQVPLTGSEQPTEKPMDNAHKDSIGRISGVKTFFTKLHPGAMEFLDEQIKKWLKENPGVSIKLTNTTTGEVQAKKTEPNIIIHVWY